MSFHKAKNRYQLKEKLGSGGMGVVYRARDTVINADVALKTLTDITDLIALRMFREECDKLAKIVHPNVVEIRDVGEMLEAGVRKPYLVMPFLRGRTLDSLIVDSPDGLSLERALEILLQASRGLQATHDAGLIHRDIKPSNIFVLEDDSVKLIDFGVAHYAENLLTISRKGTLMYMAPEQVAMRGISALSDIFSLGVVAYETLTGGRPFEGGGEKELVETILHRNPVPASHVNPRLNSLISKTLQKALAKLPEYRFQSAREFGETLRKAALNQPIAIFDPVRIEARLEQASSALGRGDLDLAGDIVNQLELQGCLDERISEVKQNFEHFRDQRILSSLLASARARIEAQEFALAAEKVEEALQLDPGDSEAAGLGKEIERQRAEHTMAERLAGARDLAGDREFGRAKQLVEEALEVCPNGEAALSLRSEIQRSEQNYNALLFEKRRLARHAEQSMTDSDPARALEFIERALDLDRQAPEAGKPEGDLRNLYDRILSASEDVEQSLEQAGRLFQAADFTAALGSCDRALSRFPDHVLLRNLRLDIENAQLQRTAHLIAQTEREIEAEPDFDRQVEILKSAAERFPEIAHFSASYDAAYRKRALRESLRARARAAEQEHRLEDALTDWNFIRSVHPGHPGLEAEIDRLERDKELQTDYDLRQSLLHQIRHAIAADEFAGALHVVRTSDLRFGDDPEFVESKSVAENGIQREEHTGHLMNDAAQLMKEARYDEAVTKLDEAAALNLRLKEIAAARYRVLLEQSRSVLDTDGQRARTLLQQAVELAPAGGHTAYKLLDMLNERSRRERVREATDRVRWLQTVQDFEAALHAAEQALVENPGDPELLHVAERLKRRAESGIRHLEQEPQAAEASPDTSSGRNRLYAAWDKASAMARRQTLARGAGRMNARGNGERLMTISSSDDRSPGGSPGAGTVVFAEKTPTGRSTPRPSGSERELAAFHPGGRPHRVKRPLVVLIGAAVATAVSLALLLPHRDRAVVVPAPPPAVHPAPIAGLPLRLTPADAELTVDGSPASVHGGTLAVTPGTHLIEVRLPGYQPFARSVQVGHSNNAALDIVLAPIPPAIHIETDLEFGSVLIDGKRAGMLEGGQFTSDAREGSHIISVIAATGGRYFFPFTLGKAPSWTITTPKSSSYGTPVAVASGKTGLRIICGRRALTFDLDGGQPKSCTLLGTDLPPLPAGNHTLAILDGSRTVAVHALHYEGNPVLTALVMTGAQFGGVAIQGTQDQFDVAVNGYPSKRPPLNGRWRRLLKPGDYTLTISKPKFSANPSTVKVSIKPGEDTLQQVSFIPVPVLASLRLHSQPGTEVSLNGKAAGTVPASGILAVHQLSTGSANLHLHQRGFTDAQQSLTLAAGENEHTILLQQLPAKIAWTVDPSNAQLTYTEQGNGVPHSVTGSSIDLPAGTYYFEASAPGHVPANSTITVSGGETRTFSLRLDVARPAIAAIDAWQGWHSQDGWLVRENPGPIFQPLPEHVSQVAFSAEWERPKSLVHWFGGSLNLVFRSSDAARSISFHIAEHGISWTSVSRGKRREGRFALKAGKNPEAIQADMQVSGVALTVNGAAFGAVGPAFSGAAPTQFGFIIEPDQVVRLRGIRITAQPLSSK